MRFRKKPVEVEAVQWTGENFSEILAFTRNTAALTNHMIIIPTLEGMMTAIPGDWIIEGVAGEYYPCKPAIFAATYEQVSSSPNNDLGTVAPA